MFSPGENKSWALAFIKRTSTGEFEVCFYRVRIKKVPVCLHRHVCFRAPCLHPSAFQAPPPERGGKF